MRSYKKAAGPATIKLASFARRQYNRGRSLCENRSWYAESVAWLHGERGLFVVSSCLCRSMEINDSQTSADGQAIASGHVCIPTVNCGAHGKHGVNVIDYCIQLDERRAAQVVWLSSNSYVRYFYNFSSTFNFCTDEAGIYSIRHGYSIKVKVKLG